MRARRSWRQQIKLHPMMTAIIIAACVLVIALIVVEVKLYGTGFAGKTLNDQLSTESHPFIKLIAHVRTLTLLHRLDGERKGIVLQFLYDAYLIRTRVKVIDLSQADLSSAELSHMDLKGSDLSSANLRGAKLNEANLSNSNLLDVDLHGADLRGTNLYKANVDLQKLEKDMPFSLKGATMPDGSIHP